jgi:Domain of unknown function (DUF397)
VGERVDEPEVLAWRKTRYSVGNGDCVEIATARGSIVVRDSKNPVGPVITYPVDAWQLFLVATRHGEFDYLF